VHPSWRDLVIAELAADAAARRRFLAHCGVDGAAIALADPRPLLHDDADWDALGDGLHHLCRELDEAAAVRLLHTLAVDGPETQALARLILERLGWGGRALSVDAVAAWLAAAARLEDPKPEPPAIAMTWLELEPHAAPRTPAELERMADWLRLADLLDTHDPVLLRGLGFPHRYADVLRAFTESPATPDPPLERELRIEALDRLAYLDPTLGGAALDRTIALRVAPVESLPEIPQRTEFPIERVLSDLLA